MDVNRDTIQMNRCEPIQDPIVMVNEVSESQWLIVSETGKLDFQAHLTIRYADASGRKYKQVYILIIHNNGVVMNKNYANPELIQE